MTSPALPASPESPSSVRSTAVEGRRLPEGSAVPSGEPACDVCPHPVASHDAIGLRFCQATLDGAMARGCICPSS